MSSAKTDELIEMLFRMWTVGPKKPLSGGAQFPIPRKGALFWRGNTRACPDMPVVNILLLIRKGGAAKYLIVDKPSRDVSDS